MFCYQCGCRLSEHDFCTACGADVSQYKKIMYAANRCYNDGLEKAGVRDLSGAVVSLRQCLKFNKNHIEARNLLGLVYFELGEVVAALCEWVISKNTRPEKNIADDYINMVQSNASRLDSINQTIKKYNQALAYCRQDSKDLAVIQLRKVLSMNSKFVKAHQLLALLYIDGEQWEKAGRELSKCMEIDRNNTLTLRYMQEVDRMLAPDESGRAVRKKTEEAVRYQSDNEIIIQPAGFKEPKRSGAGTLLNIGIGLVIGAAAMYFLVVPGVRTNVNNEAQAKIADIANQIDAKNSTITELESSLQDLQTKSDALEKEVSAYEGTDSTLANMELLIQAAEVYLSSQDAAQTADLLEKLEEAEVREESAESFRGLYDALRAAVAPHVAAESYNQAYQAYRDENYQEAIPGFLKTLDYQEDNGDALYYLAQSYRLSGNAQEAIARYQQVIELLPGTDRASRAQKYIKDLSEE